MSVDAHRLAEQYMSDAEPLERIGRRVEAARLYVLAAEAELAAFSRVPEERTRTRGLLAVSAISCYWRAGVVHGDTEAMNVLVRTAHYFLSQETLPASALTEIDDILLATQQERSRRARGAISHGTGLSVSLHGSLVGRGFAPLDTVILKLQQFEHFAMRFGECIANIPFRSRGPVNKEVLRLCQPTLSEPQSGSFRFNLVFEGQLSLFDLGGNGVSMLTPEVLVSNSYDLLDRAANNRLDDIESVIPNAEYRDTLLKHVRNIIPDGRRVQSVEIRRTDESGGVPIVLTKSSRESVAQHLSSRSDVPSDETGVKVGVLRALDLDDKWITIVEDETEYKCYFEGSQVLDDVVGPFVNRKVHITGRWATAYGTKRFILSDIELDESSEPEPV